MPGNRIALKVWMRVHPPQRVPDWFVGRPSALGRSVGVEVKLGGRKLLLARELKPRSNPSMFYSHPYHNPPK